VNQVDNSSFEYTGAWGIPNTPFPAAYSNDYAYAGSRSMRTGIPLYASANRYSYSDAWQTVYIPANATSATLHLRLYPRSAESGASSPEQVPESQASELIGAPEPGTLWGEAPLASDAQYLLILNPNTGNIIDTLLWWSPKNASSWLYREYNLLRYAGRSIRIQFGTYNNGYGGRSVMYVDQVRLDTCTTAPPPPPPPACTERLSNGGFENNSAWYIPLTAFSAGYSTYRKHTGWRSMRTGIVYWYHNRYSYSDFRQAVSIPSTATSATLSMWLFNTSGEGYGMPDPAHPTSPINGQDAAAGDVQYLLVLDRWGNWYDTLIWQRNNDQYWRYYQFNLLRFAGQTIMLQWGTYNNGWGGVTSMYVDDASLVTCP
jgi:hypothetical protein